jgi:hypothetical protein
MNARTAFHVREDGSLAVIQHADDILDYALDHTDLLAVGDTIATSVWTSDVVVITAPEQDGAIVSAFVAGTGGSVSNVVTTAAGRKKRIDFCVLAPPDLACSAAA